MGGLITLGGAGVMQYSGLLPDLGRGNAPDIPPVTDLLPLQGKLDALQEQISKIVKTAKNKPVIPVVDLTAISTRLTVLEDAPKLAALAPGSNTGLTNELQKIREMVSDLTLKSVTLANRLAMLEDGGANQLDRAAVDALIVTSMAPLLNIIDQSKPRLEQIENSVAALTKKIDEDVDARINAFDKKLKNAATGEKLAKSVAISALKSAVEEGQPFSSVLTSLETLAGSSKPLEKLKPFASQGVRTNRQLVEEFHDLQSAMELAAANNPEAGLSERLMASIQSLVTISSSETQSGGSPRAIISRIGANMNSGNFGAAISEWKTLPDPARQVSKSWIDNLVARMDTDRQMYKLMKKLNGDK